MYFCYLDHSCRSRCHYYCCQQSRRTKAAQSSPLTFLKITTLPVQAQSEITFHLGTNESTVSFCASSQSCMHKNLWFLARQKSPIFVRFITINCHSERTCSVKNRRFNKKSFGISLFLIMLRNL